MISGTEGHLAARFSGVNGRVFFIELKDALKTETCPMLCFFQHCGSTGMIRAQKKRFRPREVTTTRRRKGKGVDTTSHVLQLRIHCNHKIFRVVVAQLNLCAHQKMSWCSHSDLHQSDARCRSHQTNFGPNRLWPNHVRLWQEVSLTDFGPNRL